MPQESVPPLRRLPSVDKILAQVEGADIPRLLLVALVRSAMEDWTGRGEASMDGLVASVNEAVAEWTTRRRSRSVVNATGVLLHTNLGRAILHEDAVRAAADSAASYSNLELMLDSGQRGGRGAYVSDLLTSLTGAEAAFVVNNNAGALLLALSALGGGGEGVVSRGELIEIGGSFRLPDIMSAGGIRLVEVGTTNRTRLADYEAALTAETRLLLKVHPSNYQMTGFVASVGMAELAALGQARDVPVLFDVGSGLLDERTPWLAGPPPRWLAGEPGVHQAIKQGADLVLFSGDKLLGGPQAGVVAGRRSLVEGIRSHPLARALRIDGPSLAALSATLEMYADGRGGEIPIWAAATVPYGELETRARAIAVAAGDWATVEQGWSTPGAGSAPGARLESPVIVVSGAADRLYRLLLTVPAVPIVTRRESGRLVVDLRAVSPDLDVVVAEGLSQAWAS